MIVAAIDIGTNSMRLLVRDDETELGRWVEVTGLGRGVDRRGVLSDDAIERTLVVLREFGQKMGRLGVSRRHAIATSASRDASNREVFFDLAEEVLGVRPTLISGEEEARLAYAGATSATNLPGPLVVCDIGGGSTELVGRTGGVSLDMGSVRLTERALPERPATPGQLEMAKEHVAGLLRDLTLPAVGTLIGVAGTWTSLAAIVLGLERYDRERVHLSRIGLADLDRLLLLLASLTVAETAAIPSLDPNRAPVILAGCVVATVMARALAVGEVVVSEHDTLDAVAEGLLALP